MRKLVLLLFVFAVTGCASQGFNRGTLASLIGIKKPVTDDKDIQQVLDKKPNLPKPFKLAVYFKRPKQSLMRKAEWRWTEEDKAIFTAAAQELKDQKLVSEIIPVLGSLVTDEDLKSVRIAGAKVGADAILIVDGAGEEDSYINSAGWSYLLLVPTLFVKGNESEVLFMTNASMWDVRNEYLYLAAEAEGKIHETHTPFSGKKDEVLFTEAKTASLENLKSELVKMVKGLKK